MGERGVKRSSSWSSDTSSSEEGPAVYSDDCDDWAKWSYSKQQIWDEWDGKSFDDHVELPVEVIKVVQLLRVPSAVSVITRILVREGD
jgi:hypothetical protein